MDAVLLISALVVILAAIIIFVVARRRRSPTCNPACPSGSSCVVSGDRAKCVAGGCSKSNPCPPGQTCQGGACVGGQCKSNAACFIGQVCSNGTCVGGCRSDTECPSGAKCDGGICRATACKKNTDCPPGQICVGGECVPGGCSYNVDCPAGQVCKGHACVGGGCLTNNNCPLGQYCKAGVCIGGCGSAADCPAGHKCVRGSCQASMACKTSAGCPKGDVCYEGACIASPKCPTIAQPSPANTYILRSPGVDPSYAIGMTWSGDGYVMYPYSASASPLQKLTQTIELTPVPGVNQFLMHTPKNKYAPVIGYMVREPKTRMIVVKTVSTAPGATKYNPAKDPNAIWVYNGGVLSDPAVTVALAAKPCGGKAPPLACSTITHKGDYAAPFLTTYAPYDCQSDEYVWEFATPPE